MSWSATEARVRDASRPMGQRVNALHSLIANHHAPLGWVETREELIRRAGVRRSSWRSGTRWKEDQLLAALTALSESRRSHLAAREQWSRTRSVEKARGQRQPTKSSAAAVQAKEWLLPGGR